MDKSSVPILELLLTCLKAQNLPDLDGTLHAALVMGTHWLGSGPGEGGDGSEAQVEAGGLF